MMATTDLSMIQDPNYLEISKRFHGDLDAFADAFARAWFKLLHRDMGPVTRYLGPWVPDEELIWQDPVPAVEHDLVDDAAIATLKEQILASGLTVPQLVATAWSSASTYRDTDKRGGANGARIRLSPQADWDINLRSGVARVIDTLDDIRSRFNDGRSDGVRISLADTIVLGGCVAVERAAADGGVEISVPFTPGRTDATQDQTDVESFAVLEPVADGFRNYLQKGSGLAAEHLLLDKAFMLTLSPPEMTALVGGLRVLGANVDDSPDGVLTERPGVLSTDFFVNLLDMGTVWTATDESEHTFEGRDRATGEYRWSASRVDLVFGSNSELRALAEVYAASDADASFVEDFVTAWSKVMDLDRFDVA